MRIKWVICVAALGIGVAGWAISSAKGDPLYSTTEARSDELTALQAEVKRLHDLNNELDKGIATIRDQFDEANRKFDKKLAKLETTIQRNRTDAITKAIDDLKGAGIFCSTDSWGAPIQIYDQEFLLHGSSIHANPVPNEKVVRFAGGKDFVRLNLDLLGTPKKIKILAHWVEPVSGQDQLSKIPGYWGTGKVGDSGLQIGGTDIPANLNCRVRVCVIYRN